MPHRSHKKAIVAVAHATLITTYRRLALQTTYQDPDADSCGRRHTERARRRAVQGLEGQSCCVILEPAA
jgi:hypothetical protein